jgi:acyl CoA:acetate/3-ketoacid CoA transferase beta subunit
VLEVTDRGLRVREIAHGVSFEALQACTGAALLR